MAPQYPRGVPVLLCLCPEKYLLIFGLYLSLNQISSLDKRLLSHIPSFQSMKLDYFRNSYSRIQLKVLSNKLNQPSWPLFRNSPKPQTTEFTEGIRPYPQERCSKTPRGHLNRNGAKPFMYYVFP